MTIDVWNTVILSLYWLVGWLVGWLGQLVNQSVCYSFNQLVRQLVVQSASCRTWRGLSTHVSNQMRWWRPY